MHNSSYILGKLSLLLNDKLAGTSLLSCFSQQKEELIIEFGMPAISRFIIRADLNTSFSCLSFPDRFERSRRNNIDLFNELAGRQVESVRSYPLERLLEINFGEEWTLLFKMFGPRANILLLNRGKCTRVFKNKFRKDLNFDPSAQFKQADLSYDAFTAFRGDLKKFLPSFDNQVTDYLHLREYDNLGAVEKYRAAIGLHKKLESAKSWYIDMGNTIPVFTFFKPAGKYRIFTDPIEALNQFYQESIYTRQLEAEKSAAIGSIKTDLERTMKYIDVSKTRLNELESDEIMKQTGDIIMANLSNIPRGAERVELFNFYTGENIFVNLKPGLNPQRNAENYYRKSRNRKIEIGKLKQNISLKRIEAQQLEEKKKIVENAPDLKLLRKALGKRDIDTGQEKASKSEFRQFIFMDYEILAGKNSRNNEKLTFGSGSKDDLWLHAKDVAGSHVIIRNKPGKNIPDPVIRRAAELAAYFSKNRNNSNCPVIVVPRKYVRKLKGGSPGQVLVEREKVIFANPVF